MEVAAVTRPQGPTILGRSPYLPAFSATHPTLLAIFSPTDFPWGTGSVNGAKEEAVSAWETETAVNGAKGLVALMTFSQPAIYLTELF